MEKLLAIRSANPKISSDGNVEFDLRPSILLYLRKKGVAEGERCSELMIHDEPMKRRAEISYDPKYGLHVKVGYENPEGNGVVLLKEMRRSFDGNYVQFRNHFYPYPREEDQKIREWIEIGEKTIGPEEIPEFFKRDLVLLKSNFNAVLTEPASRIKIIEDAFKPIVLIELNARGWLEFDVNYKVGNYVLPHDIFCKGKPYVQVDENTWIRVDERTLENVQTQLKSIGASPSLGGFKVEITRFASLEEFVEKIGGIKQVSEEYQKFLDNITDFKLNPSFPLPKDIEEDLLSSKITLRPYQRAGIHWLNWLFEHSLHGILADDMGLGKTLQAILAIRLIYEKSGNKAPSLIVCPKSVIRFWHNELKRAFPKAIVLEHIGPFRSWHLSLLSSRDQMDPIILLTTYNTLVKDIEHLKATPFLFVVLDEGTAIKNPNTLRARSAKMLNAAHRLVLSGTPIENRPMELWSIFDFLMRGHLGSYRGFKAMFENPILRGRDAPALKRKIKPFILRRLKGDVAKELPEKVEMVDFCELTEEQRSLYGQIIDMASSIRMDLERGRLVPRPHIFAVITKLKQVCDHPALIEGVKGDPILGRSEKFDLVVKKAKAIVNKGEGVAIFSQFLGALDLLEESIGARSIDYIRIDGSTRDRQALIDRFNAGRAQIALLSLRAAGHGINLTAANHVIHLDRWWNPAVEDQATDRVHRIGQTRTVYVHKILCLGTLEERIDKLIEKKKEISGRAIPEELDKIEWTREELLEILKPLEDPWAAKG
ncbi:MAG: DEAD/DEAH box helicase [Candidatus Bathyarchaeia archaeon]